MQWYVITVYVFICTYVTLVTNIHISWSSDRSIGCINEEVTQFDNIKNSCLHRTIHLDAIQNPSWFATKFINLIHRRMHSVMNSTISVAEILPRGGDELPIYQSHKSYDVRAFCVQIPVNVCDWCRLMNLEALNHPSLSFRRYASKRFMILRYLFYATLPLASNRQ